MENKIKNYRITKASETLIEEQQWTTIDNEKNYHSYVKLIIQGNEEFCNEYIEDNENTTDWDINDYFDLTSESEEKLITYFQKENISHDDGIKTNWDDQPNIINAYGVTYKRYYQNIVYNSELTEKQVEEIENMGFEVEEQNE